MKIIEVDEELYQYIAANTQSIGESASDILRRLLNLTSTKVPVKKEETSSVENRVATEIEQQIPVNVQAKTATTPAITEVKSQTVTQPVAKQIVQAVKKQSEEEIQPVVARLNKVLQSEAFQQESKGVVRFLMILTALYRAHPESFAQATESLQGRTRIYFARDEATLLQSGNHTKPKQIPETPYLVITNTNSQRKMLRLEGAMTSMQLPSQLIEDVRSYLTA